MTTSKTCMLCKRQYENIKKFPCGEHACNACLDQLESQRVKMVKCRGCNSNHRINPRPTQVSKVIDKQTSQIATSRATKDAIKGMSKDDVEKIAKLKEKSTLKVLNNNYPKEQFKYQDCLDQETNQIKYKNKFSIEHLKTANTFGFIVNPIFANHLLICNNEKFFIVQQNGEVLSEHDIIKKQGRIIDVCLNDKYIYLIYELTSKTCLLIQYNFEFNFVNELYLNTPCFSFLCSENRVFIIGSQGADHNPFTAIYVIDASTLKQTDKLTHESKNNNNNKNSCQHITNPPRAVYRNNFIYVCYDDYDIHKPNSEYNRIDIIDNKTLSIKSQLRMPSWFMQFEMDAYGQFVNFNYEKQSMSIYNGSNGKFIVELKLKDTIKENTYLSYCCTNDGHLVLLRNNETLEIY